MQSSWMDLGGTSRCDIFFPCSVTQHHWRARWWCIVTTLKLNSTNMKTNKICALLRPFSIFCSFHYEKSQQKGTLFAARESTMLPHDHELQVIEERPQPSLNVTCMCGQASLCRHVTTCASTNRSWGQCNYQQVKKLLPLLYNSCHGIISNWIKTTIRIMKVDGVAN
jgi:hypothetical protein